MKKAIIITVGYNILTILSLALTYYFERVFNPLIWILTLFFVPLSLALVYFFFNNAKKKISLKSTEAAARSINLLPYKSTFFLYLLHFVLFLVGITINNFKPMEIVEAMQLALLMGAYLFFGFESACYDLRAELKQYSVVKPFPRLMWKITVTFFVFSLIPMLFIVLKSYYMSLEPDFSMDTLLRSTLITLVRTVIIALIAGGILAYTVIKPIQTLADELDYIKNGDFSREIPVYNTDETGLLSSGFNDMISGLREREKIKGTFQKYMSADAADAILHGEDQLGGHLVNVTLLFSDIRNFTTLSENYEPSEVVESLNRYFSGIVTAIESQGGMINKFIGDAVLAIFGLDSGKSLNSEGIGMSHADQAIHASMAMLTALEEFNRHNREKNLPEIKIGIGIHSGPVILGNIGSQTRMEYTVIGDSVNTASRIESGTKGLGSTILFSEASKKLLTKTIPIDKTFKVRLKGKTEIIKVYAPLMEEMQENWAPVA